MLGSRVGEDEQALGLQVLLPVVPTQLFAHQVQEGGKRGDARGRPGAHAQGARLGAGEHVPLQPALGLEDVQHQVAPGLGALGAAPGIVEGRPAHQGHQQGDLFGMQLVQAPLEVELAGQTEAVDGPVAVLTQVDLVEIGLQDLVLLVAPFQQQGHDGLVELAPQGPILGEEVVLHQLLGKRAATLHRASGAQVGPGGAGDGGEVQAVVLVELAVLHGDQRADQQGRHLVQTHQDPVLAVARVDVGDQGRLQAHQGGGAAGLQFRHGGHPAVTQVHAQAPGRLDAVGKGEAPGAEDQAPALLPEFAAADGIAAAVVQQLQFPGELRAIQLPSRVDLQGPGEHPRRQGPALALELAADLVVEVGGVAAQAQQAHEHDQKQPPPETQRPAG